MANFDPTKDSRNIDSTGEYSVDGRRRAFDWPEGMLEATENLLSETYININSLSIDSTSQNNTSQNVVSNLPQTLPKPDESILRNASRPKYSELCVRDPETGNISGYYDPSTLSPEYDAPRYVRLNYSTGVPVIDGVPFWERLPNEPMEYMEAFVHFRNQLAPRLVSKTAKHFNVSPRQLEVIAEMWMWNQRAEAFDGYIETYRTNQRKVEIVGVKAKHAKLADSLLQHIEPHLIELAKDASELEPDEMLNLMDRIIQLHRISHDLPANAPEKSSSNEEGVIINGDRPTVQIVQTKDWNPG
jgi:hypothetical protein